MGTLAQEYLRKMQNLPTRAEIEKEVDAVVAQINLTGKPAVKDAAKSGNVVEWFKKALASLTESEIRYEMSEETDKSKFPKEKAIAKMAALSKKMQAANNILSDKMAKLQADKSKLKVKANSTPQTKNKVKAAKSAITKQIKSLEAAWDKNMAVSKRATAMSSTLKDQKATWREEKKKNKAPRTADSNKMQALKAKVTKLQKSLRGVYGNELLKGDQEVDKLHIEMHKLKLADPNISSEDAENYKTAIKTKEDSIANKTKKIKNNIKSKKSSDTKHANSLKKKAADKKAAAAAKKAA
jgi:hypothetical protein